MAQLHVFGVTWRIQPEGGRHRIALPSGLAAGLRIVPGSLDGTISDGIADLMFAVEGLGGHLRAHVKFPVDGLVDKRPRASAGGTVVFFDQKPHGQGNASHELSLADGIAFPQRGVGLSLRANPDNQLRIGILNGANEDWRTRKGSPVVIAPTSSFGIALDLGSGQWTLEAGSLALHLHAPPLGGARSVQQPLVTLQQVAALTVNAFTWPTKNPEVVFRTAAVANTSPSLPPRPIFLYVKRARGTLRAGMWATGAELRIQFHGQRATWASNAGTVKGNLFSLASVTLARAGSADFALHCAGLSDSGGTPLALSCSEPIALCAAEPTASQDSVGHLVLAPQQEQELRPSATSANMLFGPARCVSFEILEPSRRQRLQLIVPALAGAPPKQAYCTSTIPRISVRSTANARLRMVTARPGESWDPKAGQRSGQWTHQGEQLALPLTPEALWDAEDADRSQARSEVDRLLRQFEEAEAPVGHDSGVQETASTNGAPSTRIDAVVTLPNAAPVLADSMSAIVQRRDPPPVVLQDHNVAQDFYWLHAVLPRAASDGVQNMQRVLLDSMDAFAQSADALIKQQLAELDNFLNLVSTDAKLPVVRGYRYAGRPNDPTTLKAIVKVSRGVSVVDMLESARLDTALGGGEDLTKYRLLEVYRQIPQADADDLTDATTAFGSAREAFEDMLPDAIRAKDWVGVLLLNVEVQLLSPLLRVLIKQDGPEGSVPITAVPFLAISGGAGGLEALSTRLRQVRRPKAPTEAPLLEAEAEEATHQVRHFDLLIEGGKFTLFDFRSRLHLNTLFGLKANEKVTRPPDGEERATGVELRGRLQQVDGKTQLVFGGAVEPPLELLDRETVEGLTIFPITQATISRIGLVMHGEEVRVTLDGSMTPRKFKWPSFGDAETLVDAVSFQGLGLRLPEMTSDVLSWLKFSYPSMRFALDLPSVELFGSMKLSFAGFGLQLPGSAPLSWDVRLNDIDINKEWSWFAFDLDFRFASLPELAGSDRKDLTFRLRLGLPFGKPNLWKDMSQCALTLSALSFEPLELNLARVFSLCVDKLHVDPNSKRIEMQNMSLSVLGTTIVQGLSAYVQPQKDGDHAFLVQWIPGQCDNGDTPDPRRGACPACEKEGVALGDLGILGVEWILGGRGLALGASDAKNLLTIPLKTEDGGDPKRPQLVDEPLPLLARDGGIAPNPDWFFAAEITVPSRKKKDSSNQPPGESSELSPLTGRLLFHDRRFYGFSLKGRFFKELFQSDLVITALFIKGRSRDTDSFYVAFTVPMVAMGVYSFQGGMISLQAFCNGDFIFDCGFPTIAPDGGRHWERALGLILTPFQGSGGFYLAKLTTRPGEFGLTEQEFQALRSEGLDWLPDTLDELKNGNLKLFELRAGLAAQVGLGAVYSSGPVTGWVTIGVFLVMEGRLTILFKGNSAHTIAGVQLQCGIGIVIRGGAQLDWWIISVRVEIVASAEARATLSYGVDGNLLSYARASGCSGAGLRDVTLNLTFDLYCSVSASACIGSSPFRVCKGITVKLHMPVHYCLKLGKIS